MSDRLGHIELKYQAGFPWYSKGGIHVKGYLFTPEGSLLRGEALARHVAAFPTAETLGAELRRSTGIFALIAERGEQVILAVDHARTLPLYYSMGKVGFWASDSVSALLAAEGSDRRFNTRAKDEFSCTGFVSGNETLAEGVFQLEAAQVVTLTGAGAEKQFYWSYQKASGDDLTGDRDTLLAVLDRASQLTFERMVQSLEGRCAVVALSGGYDSRYILGMLHRMSYGKIIAYSYGRPGNAELRRAEEVAAVLGVEFIPIPYTEELIHGFEKEDAFGAFVDFSANFTSMYFLQEYFAVRYLKEEKLVPEDAIFIPGHSADFLAGSMYLKHGLSGKEETTGRLARRLFENKFIYGVPSSTSASLKRMRQTLDEKLFQAEVARYSDGEFPGPPTSLSRYEDWDLKEKFSKFIVNSCNVYAWFGYEYRLPFYDLDFMEFFRLLPYAMKVNKNLYDSFLEGGLFKEMGILFKDEIQPGIALQKRARRRQKLKRLIPNFLLPHSLPEMDSIFYHEITARLRKDLEDKGVSVQPFRKSHNSLIIAWYLAHLRLIFPNMIEE